MKNVVVGMKSFPWNNKRNLGWFDDFGDQLSAQDPSIQKGIEDLFGKKLTKSMRFSEAVSESDINLTKNYIARVHKAGRKYQLQIRWLEVNGKLVPLAAKGGCRMKWNNKDIIVKFENEDLPQIEGEVYLRKIFSKADAKLFPRLLEYDFEKGYSIFAMEKLSSGSVWNLGQKEINTVAKVIKKYELNDVHASNMCNWAMTKDGRISIYDYGFSVVNVPNKIANIHSKITGEKKKKFRVAKKWTTKELRV